MTDLTGEGPQSFDFADEDVKKMINGGEFWDLLKHFSQEQYLMGCSHGGGGIENDMGLGILSGHAYSLLKVDELKSGGKVHRLLQIRNPVFIYFYLFFIYLF